MSSWLSISLPNPFKSDDDQNPTPPPANDQPPHHLADGAKDELSVLGNSIGRQFRSVAAFFAPPPLPRSPSPPESDESEDDHSSRALVGMKNDLFEIGGTIRSSISSLLQLEGKGNELEGDEEEEREDYEVAGASDAVLDFVQELSLRPELWTDFPLSLDNDFHMSDAQQEHASTIEELIPTFATLRRNTCSHLSEGKFWMIYFLLLLPRLTEDDIEVLSTPELLKTRELLLEELQNKRDKPVETCSDVIISPTSPEKELKTDEENTKQPSEEEDGDASTEDDVSFSDLEDEKKDVFDDRPSKVGPTEEREKGSSDSEDSNKSSDWVRLGESSLNPRGKGSSDSEDSNSGWHRVNRGDLDILPSSK